MSSNKRKGNGRAPSRGSASTRTNTAKRAGVSGWKKLGITLISLFTVASLACGVAGILTYTKAVKDAEQVGKPPATHEHTWAEGVCVECGEECLHIYEEGVCIICGAHEPEVPPVDPEEPEEPEVPPVNPEEPEEPEVPPVNPEEPDHEHSWVNGKCSECGEICEHEYDEGKCAVCGVTLFIVTFEVNGGSEIEPQLVKEGELVVRPEDPTREGYSLVNWYTTANFKRSFVFTTVIEADMTLYAKWSQNSYNVSFMNEGEETTVSVLHGNLVSAPDAPTKYGYLFEGWYADEELSSEFDFETPITQSITLYAKWTEQHIHTWAEGVCIECGEVCAHEYEEGKCAVCGVTLFVVTFEVNGGSEIEPQLVVAGKKVLEPEAPTREGYTLVAWYSNSTFRTKYTFTTAPTSDITLYARWSSNTYIVTFADNDEEKNVGVKYGNLVTAPETSEKDGYIFEGWYTDEAYTTEFDFATPITQAITLYAKWAFDKGDGLTKLYVVFDANGGYFEDGKTAVNVALDDGGNLTADSLAYVQTIAHDNANLTFGGWYVDRELLVECDLAEAIGRSCMLTARWDYRINIILDDEPKEDLVIDLGRDTVPLGTYVVVTFDYQNEGYENAMYYYSEAYLINEGNEGDSNHAPLPWIDEFDFLMRWDWVEIHYVYTGISA